MSSRANEKQTGALEVVAYLVAVVLVVGSVVGGWNFNLLIALILMVSTYAVFRDVRALSRLATRNEQTQSSDTMITLQRSSRAGRSSQQPQRMSGQQGGADPGLRRVDALTTAHNAERNDS
jgi:uncharacterized membrane protein YcjF (UPF0283 family)